MRQQDIIALCYQATMSMSSNREFYHTRFHVNDVLSYVNKHSLVYPSPELVAAALYHDAIYDSEPEKEKRSADLAKIHLKDAKDIDVDRVAELIMYTSHHDISQVGNDREGVLLVKADLYGLTDPLLTIENFLKINKESQYLYGISEFDAAAGARSFMIPFKRIMMRNHDLTKDDFWISAYMGCEATISLANAVIKRMP